MIRFIDFTKDYFCLSDDTEDLKIFGFINTVTDKFIVNDMGSHTFHDLDDVQHANFDNIERLINLIPEGYLKDV